MTFCHTKNTYKNPYTLSKINGHLVAKIIVEDKPGVRPVVAYKQAVYGIINIELFMMSVEGW